MADNAEGERKTKIISFTVYEDDYDAQVEAVLEALINNDLESGFSRTNAVTDTLANAILNAGELRFGVKRTEQIMEEGSRKRREESGLLAHTPEAHEPQ
ncbi:MAG: hypothetical protein JAZ11_00255 [Candidatus Thiodiazotropha lotti]|nr:hypothetical protein [Candidatus Thiodiazotropha lotti]